MIRVAFAASVTIDSLWSTFEKMYNVEEKFIQIRIISILMRLNSSIINIEKENIDYTTQLNIKYNVIKYN